MWHPECSNPGGTDLTGDGSFDQEDVCVLGQMLPAGPPVSAVPSRYVYGGQAAGGWQVLAEYAELQPGAGAHATTFVYGNYIDEPIAMRGEFDGDVEPLGEDFEDIYYHQDELFNVVALTAGPGGINHPSLGSFDEGAMMERYRYGDYGNVTSTDAAGSPWGSGGWSALGNRFTFTGRELDTETGWLYYRTRYMEPEWGRFTTRDTIGTWGDAGNVGNPLALVRSSPLCLADPFGEHHGDGLSPYERPLQFTPKPFEERMRDAHKRLIDSLRKSLHALCDTMTSASGSCTKERCHEEADTNANRFSSAVHSLNSDSNYTPCGGVRDQVEKSLFPNTKNGDGTVSPAPDYHCFNIGAAAWNNGLPAGHLFHANHTWTVLGPKFGNRQSQPTHYLDPWVPAPLLFPVTNKPLLPNWGPGPGGRHMPTEYQPLDRQTGRSPFRL